MAPSRPEELQLWRRTGITPGTFLRLTHSRRATPSNRYRILRKIAEGGMAEIFLGEVEPRAGHSHRVAIKRILPIHSQNPRLRAMFLDEARLTLLLHHRSIVRVMDVGQAQGIYYTVMEYVDGIDLRELLNWRHSLGAHLPIRFVVHIAKALCGALSYAHGLTHPETGTHLGIVHRDISPGNVLLSKQGDIKILDFGVAKVASRMVVTDPGIVKGKLGYLAPETARGEKVDHRADVFALGILLFEMLSTRRLFQGENDYHTVLLIRTCRIPPLIHENPTVDGALERIVRRALARRPQDRYQNAAELAEALTAYADPRGFAVDGRDMSNLVTSCAADRAHIPQTMRPFPSLVDSLLKREVRQFASMVERAVVRRNDDHDLTDLVIDLPEMGKAAPRSMPPARADSGAQPHPPPQKGS